MLEAFGLLLFYIQTFAYLSEFLKNKFEFSRKNAREIITCHIEAVRLATAQAAQARCINYHEFLYWFAYY